jgi:protein-tyrosine phosphatase
MSLTYSDQKNNDNMDYNKNDNINQEDNLRRKITYNEYCEFTTIINELRSIMITNECHRLRSLLLSDHNNSFFYTKDRCLKKYGGYDGNDEYYEIVEIKHNFPRNINNFKKIYVVSTQNDNYYKDYIIRNNSVTIPIEFIACDLKIFIKLYPEFERPYLSNDYYGSMDFVYKNLHDKSCRSNYLPGSYVLQNLIVGESMDFCEDVYNNKTERYYKALEVEQITVIVNVCDRCVSNYSEKRMDELKKMNIEVYNFPLIEYQESNTELFELNKKKLNNAIDLIHEKLSSNSKVYLHCYMGRNRSVVTTIGYLMKYCGYTFNDALLFIASKRNVAIYDHTLSLVYDHTNENNISFNKITTKTNSFSQELYDIYYLKCLNKEIEYPKKNNLCIPEWKN